MKTLRVCVREVLTRGWAILFGVLLAFAPIGGAAAPERSQPRSVLPYPFPGSGRTPAGPALSDATPLEQARLHPTLRRALQDAGGCGPDPARPGSAQQPANSHLPTSSPCFLPIVIEWARAPAAVVEAADVPPPTARDYADRLARRERVVADLQAEAQQSTAVLSSALEAAVAEGQARYVRAFWVSPIIALEAQPALIGSLSQRDDVVQIRLDQPIYLEHRPFQSVASMDGSGDLLWNLRMLDVELAAEALGLDGTGVVVANLDTGVDWQHPALLKKYRGYRGRDFAVHWGNWHVSTGEPYLYPGDGEGHGTHTMGIIVGDDDAGNRLGVAPGARWIAVKVFNNAGVAYESWIHDAFQWILAPEGDPALAPDVVSNSWGSAVGADERFRPDIAALRAGSILPVFAAGNNGPHAGTISSPGSHPEALAVGAVDEEKVVTTFSSRGPSPWGEIKPEVVAPGVNVLSAFPGGGYASGTGTSVATPHIAGLAALLLQANPALSPGQLEILLMTTAEPLGPVAPNNATGWGLVNAYAAGLRVTSSGELIGHVVRPDGGGIAWSRVTAESRDGNQSVTISGDAAGDFTIALLPGRYDVTARAFGFDPATRYAVEVPSGVQTSTTITLTAQLAGSFFGRVTDLQTGAPLSATLEVEETPVVVQTDPNTGLYSVALPQGEYQASVRAEAHRIGHLQMAVTEGLGKQADIELPSAPRILLVDSGRWYYESQIRYFEEALTASDYPFLLWPVRDPFGMRDGVGDRPTAEMLSLYDAVIWSAPLDSPGFIEADGALASFLDQGGRLLLSGQDIAFWDAGGSLNPPPSAYLADRLGLWFASEGNLADLDGVSGIPFGGLRVSLNTPDSARQQTTPDAAAIRDPLLAGPALLWPRKGSPMQDPRESIIGGITAGTCRSYRGAWVGFGLEGAGPRATRTDLLGRFLDWLVSPPALYGLVSTSEDAPLIGLAGTAVSQTLRLDNTGVNTDTVDLLLDGGPWSIDLELPDGRHVDSSTQFTLEGCSGSVITATVAIPPGQPRDIRSIHNLRFVSLGDPAATAAVTVTAKTPAPILLVDDERWYDHQDAYTNTLDALELTYDVFNAQGRGSTPNTVTLQRYPLVVWTTGYDWYSPLTADDEVHLGAYLDSGGRLLLSSQDNLDMRGVSEFVRDRLGVAEASLTVTGTEVIALAGSPLGSDLGPWGLTFPFLDWSDALLPTAQARGTLQNERLFIVGVARPAQDWRTAFFAFPLETLADAPRQTLLGRTLLWLSPMGESRLEAPPVAAEGSHAPITLTLGLATGAGRSGLRALLLLPSHASLVPGSLQGPWGYDAAAHALAWSGDLSPDQRVELRADLALATGIPDGTALPLRARLYAGDGVTVTAEAPVLVDVPWLELHEQAEPTQPGLHGTVQYTFTVTNRGVIPATGHLTDTLPAGLTPVAGTDWASSGDAALTPQGLSWAGVVAPDAQVTVGYRSQVTLARPSARLVNRAELTDQFGRRVVAWAVLGVPTQLYLPLVHKDAP